MGVVKPCLTHWRRISLVGRPAPSGKSMPLSSNRMEPQVFPRLSDTDDQFLRHAAPVCVLHIPVGVCRGGADGFRTISQVVQTPPARPLAPDFLLPRAIRPAASLLRKAGKPARRSSERRNTLRTAAESRTFLRLHQLAITYAMPPVLPGLQGVLVARARLVPHDRQRAALLIGVLPAPASWQPRPEP